MIHFFDLPLSIPNAHPMVNELLSQPINMENKIISASAIVSRFHFDYPLHPTSLQPPNVAIWVEIKNGNIAIIHGELATKDQPIGKIHDVKLACSLIVMTED